MTYAIQMVVFAFAVWFVWHMARVNDSPSSRGGDPLEKYLYAEIDNPDVPDMLGEEGTVVIARGMSTKISAISNKNFAKYLVKYVLPHLSNKDWEEIEQLRNLSEL